MGFLKGRIQLISCAEILPCLRCRLVGDGICLFDPVKLNALCKGSLVRVFGKVVSLLSARCSLICFQFCQQRESTALFTCEFLVIWIVDILLMRIKGDA